ncbi:hypothetical protein MB901379_01491 [Mycobacterium basiliense]|uniref:Trypsin n=1 Tax=Mycobacterium basiliense TaxID=2094119 RepID=A0A447GBS1_9MYCO|nr:hypothetical protein [Mycobacterium basiliense]VDM87940.1 hypothetical protein MB901379_01491 [Mycobacterium basiliense]
MGTMFGGSCRSAVATALALVSLGAPAAAEAKTGLTVFPGMQIRQGSVACTVGFVETKMRIALSAGQCNGGPTVTDSERRVVGEVLLARRNIVGEVALDGATAGIEYEVIRLSPEVTATDRLPSGRQLQSSPGFRVRPALPVCHFGATTGQVCGGRVGSVSGNRFSIADLAADKRDLGGPVYALGDDNQAVIVGLLDGTRGSLLEAQSWHVVMRQLYLDSSSLNSPQPPLGGLTTGR